MERTNLREVMESWYSHVEDHARGLPSARCVLVMEFNGYLNTQCTRDIRPDREGHYYLDRNHDQWCSFVTELHAETDFDIAVEVTLTTIINEEQIQTASLGKIFLKKGKPQRLPFVGKMKPIVVHNYGRQSWYISFSYEQDGNCFKFFPTRVRSTAATMTGPSGIVGIHPVCLRMTPTRNFVTDGSITTIEEEAELGPWMRYGAFLWLLRKHHKDIITRLYRPDGRMAKRMEKSIYGAET